MRIRRYWLACFLLVSATAAGHADGQTCGPWTRSGAEPPFGGASLDGVTWGEGQFVAVGDGGLIVTSPDGVAWTRRESGCTTHLQGIAWNGSRFVAVGYGGTILLSDDAVSWRSVEGPTDLWLDDVTWSGSRFIAVGSDGAVIGSGDGENWELATTLSHDALAAVACGGGICIAGGSSPWSSDTPRVILRAVDGIAWETVDASLPFDPIDIAWTGERFVAVGRSLDNAGPASSEDGLEWTFHWSRAPITGQPTVAVGDDEVIVFGGAGELLASADGIVWAGRSSALGSWVHDAVWGAGRWVAVGSRGETAVSEDGASWAVAVPTLFDGFFWRAAASNGSLVVAAGSDTATGAPFVYRTADGATWQRLALDGASGVSALSWFNELLLGSSDSGMMRSSDGGASWAPVTLPPGGATASGIACSAVRCVAVGASILTSDDALTWRRAPLPWPMDGLWDVAWTGASFVAVGRSGSHQMSSLLMRSADGERWEESRDAGFLPSAVAAGGAALAAIGYQPGRVFTSTDGFAWQDHELAEYAQMRDVVWTGSYFAVLATKGYLRTVVWVSRDGAAWSEIAVPGSLDLREIAGSGPRLYLFGEQGTILSTSCGDSVGSRSPRRRLQVGH